MFYAIRRPGGAGWAVTLVAAMVCAQGAFALSGASSASFRIDRTSVNNGSAVQSTSGGSYKVVPHVIGAPAVGRSTSASFALNQGRIGGLVQSGDDVWVGPLWVSQADVDADPTIGLLGCKTPPFPVVFGVNAFQTIAGGVAAVNTGGRVHLMNGTIEEENIALAKRVQIIGEDEAFGTCTGLPGRLGATVVPQTAYAPAKPVFHVQSDIVSFADLQIDGDNAAVAGATEADFGVYSSDATGTLNNTVVRNVGIRNFADHAVYLNVPNTTGHIVEMADMQFLGDYVTGGSAQGGAVLFAGASGRVTSGTITMATTGISVYGDAPGTLASVSGTNARPNVTVQGVDILSVGGNGSTGEGAIAFLHNATGSINSNTLEGADRGIQIAHKFTPDQLTATNNALTGPMEAGIDIRDIYAAPAEVVASSVLLTGNVFTQEFDKAAIALRFIGEDSTGSAQNLGGVSLIANVLQEIDSTSTPAAGVFIAGVDPVFGSVSLTGNTIDGLSGGNVGNGIQIASNDLLFGVLGAQDSANITIDDGVISDWTRGVSVSSTVAAGLVTLSASIGTNAPNDITRASDGVFAGRDANVTIGNASAGLQRIAESNVGVSVDDVSALANLSGNLVEQNDTAGVRVSNGGNAMLEDNIIIAGISPGAVGVLASAGGGTIDLGGGAFGSAGGNVLNVLSSNDNWAVALDAAGLYAAEFNTWQYQGATYNGPVAIDDLIKDGDTDNPIAGGEGFTAGPLDFIPFQQDVLAAVVSLDDDYVRGGSVGYGVTEFRALADVIEGVANAGIANAADGTYLSKRYDTSGNYTISGTTISRPMTIAGVSATGAVIVPPADGIGTTAGTIREAGSQTLLEIASDDVTLSRLVLDGDNPAVAGTVTLNGSDINARNGAVIVASAGDGPDNLTFNQLTVRNLYYRGVASDPSIGNASANLVLSNSSFDNIDGFQNLAAASSAVDLTDVSSTLVSSNTINNTRRGVVLTANDALSSTTIVGNMLTNIDDRGIAASGVSNTASIHVTGNNIASQNIGIEISDASAGGLIVADNNTVVAAFNGVNALSVSGTSLLAVRGNSITGNGLSTGVRTHATVAFGADRGVEVSGNTISQHAVGLHVENAFPGLPAAANAGTFAENNTFQNNGTGVRIADTSGLQVYASVGGADASFRNFFTNNTTAVSISGAATTADVRHNSSPAPPFVPVISNQAVGVLVSDSASARIVGNRFDNSSIAAIRITDAGSDALIETNEMNGTVNLRGILIENSAIASMGPGPAATISNPFYGGIQSIGLNKMRDYAGASNYAIHNTSAFDQNAENNDFGSLDLLYIEQVVEHQPDNGQGRVFYDPPSDQFLAVEDWHMLE